MKVCDGLKERIRKIESDFGQDDEENNAEGNRLLEGEVHPSIVHSDHMEVALESTTEHAVKSMEYRSSNGFDKVFFGFCGHAQYVKLTFRAILLHIAD